MQARASGRDLSNILSPGTLSPHFEAFEIKNYLLYLILLRFNSWRWPRFFKLYKFAAYFLIAPGLNFGRNAKTLVRILWYHAPRNGSDFNE